jgi:hypothetical protein
MRLRKEFTDLPSAARGEGDGGRVENMEGVPEGDIMSYASEGVEAGENPKMTERSGNVVESKGTW